MRNEFSLPDGFEIATYAPGDGVRRYKIVPIGESYFSAEGPVALGRKQAAEMCQAFTAGYEAGRSEK